MNKDAIKKYHFLALFVLASLLSVASVAAYWNDVGAEIDKKEKVIKGKKDEVAGARAKGQKMLAELDKQKEFLVNKREELWKDNWERQAVEYKLFAWPPDDDALQRLREVADKHTKFGEEIKDPKLALNDIFKKPSVYERAYDLAAQAIEPTTFPGRKWRSVLRYVSEWGSRQPSWQQIWLALEDLWVQRALLLPVKELNDAVAAFSPAPPAAGQADPSPFKRTFRSRIWEVELDVSNRRTLRGRLTNRTDRLQLLGVGNTLRLKVWLSDRPGVPPVGFPIEGEFLKAGETKEVQFVPALHTLPPGAEAEVTGVYKVEQVLDERTVPVRQVLAVELGYPDGRTAAIALRPPPFFTDEATGAAPAPAAVVAKPAKNGTPAQVLDGNKARYFDQTEQVRRMPVAVTLVVDQMFMQDALVSYANSPLRLQITQVYWRRARRLADAPPNVPLPGDFDPTATGVPGGSAPLAGLSEGQLTSGLVELTLHGVISLYEKYEPKGGDGAAAAAPPGAPAAEPPAPPK